MIKKALVFFIKIGLKIGNPPILSKQIEQTFLTIRILMEDLNNAVQKIIFFTMCFAEIRLVFLSFDLKMR
jgi:hypothetical protein